MNFFQRFTINAIKSLAKLASVSVRVDDSPGWGRVSGQPHERTAGEIQELYEDTLEAWRKNPIAKRIVDITTDYVVGDGIRLTSPNRWLNAYIDGFWTHQKNMMPLRLEGMCEELTRGGNLLPLLFLNEADGMSYIRFVTIDQVRDIITLPSDWETITEIAATRPGRMEPDKWKTQHVAANEGNAVISLYPINKPIGALTGEGDLATVIPWLLRYSRMLEDRVRLNWAVRTFLWFVKVQSGQVEAKREQYKKPPEAGSVIVHDDGEEWDMKTPNLHANDASHDMSATRRMIYAATGYPPHWYGEQGSNLAEARAMQSPAERHLRRRQLYFTYILQDLIVQGYKRVNLVRNVPKLPTSDYNKLFSVQMPDLSREDNGVLAESAYKLSQSYKNLVLETLPQSRSLTEKLLGMVFKFAGEPESETVVKKMVDEMFLNLDKPATRPRPE